VKHHSDAFIKGTLGGDLKSGLGSILRYGNDFALQGVEYSAAVADNFLPLGSSERSINEMARLLTDIANKCPNARIAAGGYRSVFLITTLPLFMLIPTKSRRGRGCSFDPETSPVY
jgi:hypothetical protein